MKLHALNFVGLPVDVSILEAAAKKGGYAMNDEFKKLAQGLSSPLLAHDHPILIAIEFLKVVYTSFQYAGTKNQFASVIIDNLFRREINLRVLANVLAAKFILLHQEREYLIEKIRQKISEFSK